MSYETNDQKEAPPVTDWVNDWDWLDEQWGANAIGIWNDVRSECPMASTERYGRAFMPVTMEAVSAVANDTENFSSIWVNVARPDAVRSPAPPITSDPPEHRDHRRLLLPAFGPKVIAAMEEDLRQFSRGLIADIGDAETADATVQYAQHIPVHGICQMLGIPESDADMFRDWIFRSFQLAPRDNAVREELRVEMDAYIGSQIKDREANPKEDLTTLIAQAAFEDGPADWELKIGYVKLMILAGIDTTWSAIGSGIWHIGHHPDQRDRLAAADLNDPIWHTATEEVLRYYAPVTMARKVIGETEIAGCPVHPGDQMLLTFPAANHDPEAFDKAEVFDLERAKNRHVAFGQGIHRCLGSNLARLELLISMQEWIRAFPNYTLVPEDTTWANGQIRGPRTLPVTLNQ